MTQAILALLTMLAQLSSTLGAAAQIASVIATLEQIIPLVIKEYQDVVPIIKNVIAALRGNGSITAEQQAQLDALDALADQEFEAAAAAAQAEDANSPQ